jgi:hypothetical protein
LSFCASSFSNTSPRFLKSSGAIRFLSIRQLRYPLASLRHSSSLTPLLSFRHFRYWEIRCLHSPVDC